jgi:hypothetical protein
MFFDDLGSLDPDLHKNLLYVKNYAGDFDDLSLNFVAVEDHFGEAREHELVPGGKDIPVPPALRNRPASRVRVPEAPRFARSRPRTAPAPDTSPGVMLTAGPRARSRWTTCCATRTSWRTGGSTGASARSRRPSCAVSPTSCRLRPPPPGPPRTKWTCRVPHPVLIGHPAPRRRPHASPPRTDAGGVVWLRTSRTHTAF